MAGMKVCPICGKDFYDGSKSHTKNTCSIKCRDAYYYQSPEKKFKRDVQTRLANMKSQHGIEFDSEAIERIKADLKFGKCKICGKERQEGEKDFHIDHDHITGEYRGVLCLQCNHALGNIQDSPLHAIALCEYLIEKNARGIDFRDDFWGGWIVDKAQKLIETIYGAE